MRQLQFCHYPYKNEWKETMRKREELTKSIASFDKSFVCVRYYDTSVSFYYKSNELLEESA